MAGPLVTGAADHSTLLSIGMTTTETNPKGDTQ